MDNFLKQDDRRIPVDKEGYLKNLADWDEEVALVLAESCDIRLQDAHWEVIRAVRKFYQD